MKNFLLLTFLVILNYKACSQDTFIFRGRVIDAETSVSLPGASISIRGTRINATTEDGGFFQIRIPEGAYTVSFSFVGFISDSVTINTKHLTDVEVRLHQSPTTLDSVVVSTKQTDEKLLETETGHVVLQRKELQTLPYLLGELDPIRILQLMPGVQTAGEGSTGYYVRGGAIDQNLMLLDNATVYNPSHLFGFFSIFNGSVVSSLEMFKSGIPSYYGGRLSSVTKITTRKGDANKFRAEGGIGVIATNLLIEGPIVKNKGSLLIAARRTYVDFFAQKLHDASILKRDINYYFYDLNV
ncbi:MAG TPA: TonB-dependent receptor, partial [Cyclobacteriaceae bacterium]